VIDAAPPRRRRGDPGLVRDLEALERADLAEGAAIRIRRAGFSGIDRERLRREMGAEASALDRALADLQRAGRAEPTAGGSWLDAAALAELEQRLLAALDAWHAAEPLRPGMPAGALRGRLPANAPRDAAELALALLAARGELALEGDLARRPRAAWFRCLRPRSPSDRRATSASGLEPPGTRELGRELDLAPERLRELLAHLEREGRIVRARDELWFDRAAIDTLRERVRSHLRAHGPIETLAYKGLIGTPRRTAIPLMELFDAERLTLRRGEQRLLRGGAAGAG
jgi:selenocysteine-specific elongation factor